MDGERRDVEAEGDDSSSTVTAHRARRCPEGTCFALGFALPSAERNDEAEPWKAGVSCLQAGSVLLLPLCVLRDCVI